MLPRLPWYRRVQLQICIDYKMFPNSKDMSLKEWAFSPCFRLTVLGQEVTNRWQLPDSSSWSVDTYNLDHSKDDKKFYSNVFWITTALRILGLDCGIGFYYRGNKH